MGYGICPQCFVANPPGSSRDRSPDGCTQCGACGHRTLSSKWRPTTSTPTPEGIAREAEVLAAGFMVASLEAAALNEHAEAHMAVRAAQSLKGLALRLRGKEWPLAGVDVPMPERDPLAHEVDLLRQVLRHQMDGPGGLTLPLIVDEELRAACRRARSC